MMRPPPGITLNPGERLTVGETVLVWIAYLFEVRYDAFLAASSIAVLFDMTWTPCLWLLPLEASAPIIAVGIVRTAT